MILKDDQGWNGTSIPMETCELSVGKNANLLLNTAPYREGRLPDATVKRLLEFGEPIRKLEKK